MTAMPPKWLLVADDDRLVRELWVDALIQAGYRTLQAENGHDAIELMRAVVPHLVLLDLRMPASRAARFCSIFTAPPSFGASLS
jgi:CheY-like chemotaxis protein